MLDAAVIATEIAFAIALTFPFLAAALRVLSPIWQPSAAAAQGDLQPRLEPKVVGDRDQADAADIGLTQLQLRQLAAARAVVRAGKAQSAGARRSSWYSECAAHHDSGAGSAWDEF